VLLVATLSTVVLAAAVLWAPDAAQAAEVLLRVGDTSVPVGTIVYGDAIAVGGRLDIAGTVTGNAVAAGGTVRISGHVGGNVRAIGGDAVLDSTAVVGGSVHATGGHVTIAPGAAVEQGGPTPGTLPFPIQPRPGMPFWMPAVIFGILATLKLFAGLLLLLSFAAFIGTAWLTAALFPGPTAFVAAVLERNPGGAGIAGILVWLLLGPVIVLLVVSIIGIPVALLLIAALLVAIQLGISAVAVLLGNRVRPGRIAIEALAGAVLLAIAFAIPHLGWLAAAACATWGTGGVVMAIVERRRRRGTTPPPPAAPQASVSPGPSAPASMQPPCPASPTRLV
jgi:hypothetical protein